MPSQENAERPAEQEAEVSEEPKRHFLYRISLPFKHVIKRASEIAAPILGTLVAGPIGFLVGVYAVGAYEGIKGVYQYFKQEQHASGLGSAIIGAAYLLNPYLGMGLSAAEGAYKTFTNKLFPHEVADLRRIDNGNYLTALGYVGD